MNQEIVFSLVRHLLTAVGGGLAVKYGIDGAQIDAIAGGLAALAGIGWSIFEKRKSK